MRRGRKRSGRRARANLAAAIDGDQERVVYLTFFDGTQHMGMYMVSR
jgi:hypothetical protein